ncbi:hypothetical protein P175DRAFT_0481585 [Aspergillus ochraceoroseus IBT 24754]|uniref:FAD-binding domain-containing protein n=3 Tax=Aspergillus subgen. Nidulantes TaxID=2720870 RepID=A0A0F8X3Y5_9EURO|nr:uncharacterized protein P175DRAFT_0481585 [Aspergillus ochraceoroseus IBT 24754]KKK18222.1 hypothetical protein ARAM_002976 [Aspergillus rambellii]KKK18302.1 hypothetical protein AOCH_003476 [Aspergillus ochraceoroseus]PTU20329.1 hypothetical protein P175DRAFT_0481585 [Aspergillus ochraceoroseus IBT 24754]
MEQSPSIAIIGGGPSGLLFARLLELNGISDYVVFERDQSSEQPGRWQQGGTLDLHGPSGQLALKRAELFEKFSHDFARWDASSVRIVNPAGATVALLGENRNAPEIDRLQLRQLLLDSIPAHKILWGHAVKSIERKEESDSERKDNGCIVHFVNGESASGFRLLVGADGAWSKVRSLLTAAKPVYSGKMFIEGYLSHDNQSYTAAREMAGAGNMMAMGHHKKIAVQQVADGTYRVYFGLCVPESFYDHRDSSGEVSASCESSKSETLRRLLLSSNDFYASWAPGLRRFIENSEGPFRAWPLYRMEPEAVSWERNIAPAVTLLGDAAHVSTPFVGEGVNCSMNDAVVLADYLVAHLGKGAILANVEEAALETVLASYEEDMFVRGRDLIRRSMEIEERIFADDAVTLLLELFNGGIEKSGYVNPAQQN